MIKTESELYFKILEFLSIDAFTKKQHVEGLLFDYFKRNNFYNMEDLEKRIEVMVLFIYNMAQVGHVKYSSSIALNLSRGNLLADSIPTLKDFSVWASITPEGFLFLNKERDRLSAKINNRLQIWLAIITMIFIGMTAVYAKFTYDLQNRETLKQKEKIRLIQSSKMTQLKADTIKNHRKESTKNH